MNDDDRYNRLVEAAHARIDRLERLVKNSNNAPTIPSYDHTNFPQDAVYGQIAKDYNDHTAWVYGEDDAWHQIGGGVANHWITTQLPLGTVAASTTVNGDMAGSIVYQTDTDQSVYKEIPGIITTIGMLQIGSYLVRAKATYQEGKTGYVNVNAVIGGPCTTYDWDDDERFHAASIPDTTAGTDMGKYGGLTTWSQLCVVHNLSTPTGAYVQFINQTTGSLIGTGGYLQILRLT